MSLSYDVFDVSAYFFWPDERPIGKSGVLKSPTTYRMILVCAFQSSSTFFYELGVPEFGEHILRIVMSSWVKVS